MRRIKMMTIGFVLVMMGVQLNLVDSYELTPRFSNFLSEQGGQTNVQPMNANYNPNNPLYQRASYPNPVANYPTAAASPAPLKVIQHPRWLCWPVLFCGAVLVLQGFIRKD